MSDNIRYVTRDDLRVTTDREEVYIGQPGMGQWITLRPGEAREVRDAITHWLDHREDEEDDDEFLWGFMGIEETDDE